MKVIDFVDRWRMCSNARLFVRTTLGIESEIEKNTLRDPDPNDPIMKAKVLSFDVVDNKVTLYAEGEKK